MVALYSRIERVFQLYILREAGLRTAAGSPAIVPMPRGYAASRCRSRGDWPASARTHEPAACGGIAVELASSLSASCARSFVGHVVHPQGESQKARRRLLSATQSDSGLCT